MLTSDTSSPPWRNVVFYKGNIYNSAFFYGTYNPWSHEYKTEEIELNKLREQIRLHEMCDTGQWEYYKKIINPYELIFTQKKYDNFPESVCILHPLSRSYFKMIEILHISDFFKTFEREPRLRTAHVCEGPGGFIEAILEESTKRNKQILQMTAMTLRPNQPNVPGWKRATTFLRKSKQVCVTYGVDNTGDITKIANQDEYIRTVGSQKVNIFTSDGGFDFSMDYMAQERFVFPLLLSSTRIGFETLADGGYFVMKFFDCYYKPTRDLVYFLSCFFRSWTLYKPATSRPCNPEQYFIGRGFIGASDEVKAQLKNWCIHNTLGFVQSGLCDRYSPEFIEQIEMSQSTLITNQTGYLQKVFDCIEHNTEEAIQRILHHHEYHSYQWCKTFNVPVYPARAISIERRKSATTTLSPSS
jgi:23S rRNA U2552 (ribose-2'-O)-methylase RlmE/FtsJ